LPFDIKVLQFARDQLFAAFKSLLEPDILVLAFTILIVCRGFAGRQNPDSNQLLPVKYVPAESLVVTCPHWFFIWLWRDVRESDINDGVSSLWKVVTWKRGGG
jgi:hypothetical protein